MARYIEDGLVAMPLASEEAAAWRMYGRWQYLHNISKPVLVPTKSQVADIFTKPLDKTSFLKFRDILLNVQGPKH